MSADRDEMAERIKANNARHYLGCGWPAYSCSCERIRQIATDRARETITDLGGGLARVGDSFKAAEVSARRFGEAVGKLQPGVLIDEQPDSFYMRLRRPRDWYAIRRALKLSALRVAMVGGGAAVMYAEGRHQPQPGVWFAVALALMLGACLVGSRDNA